MWRGKENGVKEEEERQICATIYKTLKRERREILQEVQIILKKISLQNKMKENENAPNNENK